MALRRDWWCVASLLFCVGEVVSQEALWYEARETAKWFASLRYSIAVPPVARAAAVDFAGRPILLLQAASNTAQDVINEAVAELEAISRDSSAGFGLTWSASLESSPFSAKHCLLSDLDGMFSHSLSGEPTALSLSIVDRRGRLVGSYALDARNWSASWSQVRGWIESDRGEWSAVQSWQAEQARPTVTFFNIPAGVRKHLRGVCAPYREFEITPNTGASSDARAALRLGSDGAVVALGMSPGSITVLPVDDGDLGYVSETLNRFIHRTVVMERVYRVFRAANSGTYGGQFDARNQGALLDWKDIPTLLSLAHDNRPVLKVRRPNSSVIDFQAHSIERGTLALWLVESIRLDDRFHTGNVLFGHWRDPHRAERIQLYLGWWDAVQKLPREEAMVQAPTTSGFEHVSWGNANGILNSRKR